MNHFIHADMSSNPTHTHTAEVVIIGAGPSGTVLGSLLFQAGLKPLILEKARFPRFCIGESLLPQCMDFIHEAGFEEAVEKAGFQFKNGASFISGGQHVEFDFSEKSYDGYDSTFQVQRGKFDQILADTAAAQGVDIRYGHTIQRVEKTESGLRLTVGCDEGSYVLEPGFVADASGYGRVLPRFLDLDKPAGLLPRASVFNHFTSEVDDFGPDRNKIRICTDPDHKDTWVWWIPFSDNTCSVGVVTPIEEFLQSGMDESSFFMRKIERIQPIGDIVKKSTPLRSFKSIQGYSASVKSLYGDGFVLLGNSGEFIDPVFSSGVTIAMKSSSLAAPLIVKQLKGETVDWEVEFTQPLMQGVECFRAFVNAWYDGRFQEILFSKTQNPTVRFMICSILAGYVWDEENRYAVDSVRLLDVLVAACRIQNQ